MLLFSNKLIISTRLFKILTFFLPNYNPFKATRRLQGQITNFEGPIHCTVDMINIVQSLSKVYGHIKLHKKGSRNILFILLKKVISI